ncbi:radical SAM family heme chaperone HemW [Aquibacillus salsiterrae]|uniref:Heme chaperone HemW n=1 Tax=Aquibacillus salsiterrae TaxID=2950439 RepID=A0A9X3WDS1_9BACI|nr:radical SAM family heme chaperone HemW [Aquibacillus salsiterrae]MDC3415574.1 radical SAM family heme chaperone HemW [Aquibacillus salsiterrae]
MVSSVYIHIPFCHHLCHYCDFTKFFYNEAMADEYLEALQKEMSTYVEEPKQAVKTIFVGGGTPTALNDRQLKALLETISQYFNVSDCEEYTFEANPGDLNVEKIKLLKAYGVNRISMGVQVFDNQMLEELGRFHRIKDVYQNIDALAQHNLSNVSIDLIYSLPNQTVEHFDSTLKEALSFNLPHYSAYSLQIEPKTVFYQRFQMGKLQKPKEEDEAEMFQLLRDRMEAHGKVQYEISNFAKPGWESKHNLTYWNNDFYFGFGAGAHGYLPGKRIINVRPFPAYVKKAMENGRPVLHIDEVGKKERIEEEMFLGLRKIKGVSKRKFQSRYGLRLESVYRDALRTLVERGWIYETDDTVALTEEGQLFGNEVFQEFLLDDDSLKLSH